jgi:hypothetical protein
MSTPHLIGAIRNYLLAQPELVAVLPGGIADGQAGRDDPLAYMVLQQRDANYLRLFGGREIAFLHIEVSTFATTRSAVETAGNLARDILLPPDDQPAWSPIGIAGGWRDVNRQPAGGDAIEIDAETRAAYGKDVWVCRRSITWTLARG